MKLILTFLVLVFLLPACTSNGSALKGIDLTSWKQDRNGCNGKRAALMSAVVGRKDELLGLGENEVLSLLGRPDRTELYANDQKFYHYFMTPSPDCGQSSSMASQLIVRFSATAVTTEVTVE